MPSQYWEYLLSHSDNLIGILIYMKVHTYLMFFHIYLLSFLALFYFVYLVTFLVLDECYPQKYAFVWGQFGECMFTFMPYHVKQHHANSISAHNLVLLHWTIWDWMVVLCFCILNFVAVGQHIFEVRNFALCASARLFCYHRTAHVKID